MAEILSGLVPGAPVHFAVDSGGQVYGVNGVDPPFVWDGVSTNSVRNWGIAAPPAPSAGSTSGTGLTGVYYYQITWYNANTGEYGEPLAVPLGPFTLTNQGYTVNRPSITVPTVDTQVTGWKLWRTTAGQGSVYYLVATKLTSDTSTTDNVTDAVASAGAVLDEHYRPDASKPYIKFCKGRFVLYGSRVEKSGTIQTTIGSAAIVGTSTNFRQSHVGQKLYVDGEAVYYVVLSVTDATHLTLTANYAAGTSASGKTFRMFPFRTADIAWSKADSESFGLEDFAGVFPADGDMPTGLEIVGTSLIPWKRSHAYLFDYGSDPDPLTGSGNISLVLSSRGLARQECCVPVGQSAFVLDAQGIYQFDGSSQEVAVDQAIRRLFQPDDEIPAAYRINRQYSDQWHGVYDQRTDSVLFFVTTGSETTPQTALRFSRERQQWTMDKFNQGISASCQGRDSYGEYRAWVGDANKWLWALSGTRQCEGNSTGTLEGTATAATSSTLTDSGAAFPTATNGLKGVYVTIRSGTNAGESRLITANTATQLTVSPNWSVTPDTTSQYVVGAIESTWKSVWHFCDPPPAAQAKSIELLFEPTAAGRSFKVRFYKDFETTPIKKFRVAGKKDGLTISSTVSSDGWMYLDGAFSRGRIKVAFPDNFSTCFAVELSMLSAGEPVLIRGYDLESVQVPAEFP